MARRSTNYEYRRGETPEVAAALYGGGGLLVLILAVICAGKALEPWGSPAWWIAAAPLGLAGFLWLRSGWSIHSAAAGRRREQVQQARAEREEYEVRVREREARTWQIEEQAEREAWRVIQERIAAQIKGQEFAHIKKYGFGQIEPPEPADRIITVNRYGKESRTLGRHTIEDVLNWVIEQDRAGLGWGQNDLDAAPFGRDAYDYGMDALQMLGIIKGRKKGVMGELALEGRAAWNRLRKELYEEDVPADPNTRGHPGFMS